jgi:hypothetical protein
MKRWIIYAVAGLLALGAGYFASQLSHKTPCDTKNILEGGTALRGEKNHSLLLSSSTKTVNH